jgi:hypothetical protein
LPKNQDPSITKTRRTSRHDFILPVEDGEIDRNPCTGINVRVSEFVQKVLTNKEVEIFLNEAKLANHRFYPV